MSIPYNSITRFSLPSSLEEPPLKMVSLLSLPRSALHGLDVLLVPSVNVLGPLLSDSLRIDVNSIH